MYQENNVLDLAIIVDDTPVDRYTASYVIKKHGFAREVLEFDMATKAIAYLEENKDNLKMLPQVILLDISMPEMDGFQFLDRLAMLPQCVKQSCCIVMLSSSLNPSDHERAENNPVVKKFINKPLSKGYLEEIKQLYEKMAGKEQKTAE